VTAWRATRSTTIRAEPTAPAAARVRRGTGLGRFDP
jgi:hypothetical protein